MIRHGDIVNEVNSSVRLGLDGHPVSVTLSGSNECSEMGNDGATCSGSIQYSELYIHQTASGSIENCEWGSPSVSVTDSGDSHNSKLCTDQTIQEINGRHAEMITDKVTLSVSSQEHADLLGDTDSDSGIREELEYLLRPSEDSSQSDDDDIVDPNQKTCSVKIVVEASVHYEPARELCDDSPDEIDVAEVFYLWSPEGQGHKTGSTKTVGFYSE